MNYAFLAAVGPDADRLASSRLRGKSRRRPPKSEDHHKRRHPRRDGGGGQVGRTAALAPSGPKPQPRVDSVFPDSRLSRRELGDVRSDAGKQPAVADKAAQEAATIGAVVGGEPARADLEAQLSGDIAGDRRGKQRHQG